MIDWNEHLVDRAVTEATSDEVNVLAFEEATPVNEVDAMPNNETTISDEADASEMVTVETGAEEPRAYESGPHEEHRGDTTSPLVSDREDAGGSAEIVDGTDTGASAEIVDGADTGGSAETAGSVADAGSTETVGGVNPGGDAETVGSVADVDNAETVDGKERDVRTTTVDATEREASEADSPRSDGAIPPDLLVMEMVDELTGGGVSRNTSSRRNRKHARNGPDTIVAAAPVARRTAALNHEAPPARLAESEPDDADVPADAVVAGPAEADGNDWRQQWPRNELLIFGRLDMFVSFAPTIDGVTRVRAAVEIMEIDGASDAAGVVARVPVQILPQARGFRAMFGDMARTPKPRQRARPVAVELRGSSKCLQDRDRRYANARWTTLFGLEVTSIKRVDENASHYGRWRGTGVVSAVRPFEFDYARYFRVTLSVVPAAQKAQLRGTSSAVDLVDILVRDDHEHAARFRHVGQRLLVEAEVCSQTSVLRESHPDLEGLDDETKERLRVLREGILLATMGEFPDDRAETDWEEWDRAGRPMPAGRPGRRLSPEKQRARQQRLAEQRARERAASVAVLTAEPA